MTDRLPTHTVARLAEAALGRERARDALNVLAIDPRLCGDGDPVSRAEAAMALNVLLFADLLERVPGARRYADETAEAGRKLMFDHGALRTIDGPTGDLPQGRTAFARMLEPLGYRIAATYPLPAMKMTGYAFAHEDFAECVPQFFVSELHMAQLAAPAQEIGARVFGTSVDPLGSCERAFLDAMAAQGRAPFAQTAEALPGLAAAFDRQHRPPDLADYETLLPLTAEGAWIATEGNAFNHATNRVEDVDALAADLAARGYRMKPKVEVSSNGRVRQTALIADTVRRPFRAGNGEMVERDVPGSFFEFISRDPVPETGALDLTFDSGNATGIFSVTRGA